MLTQTHLPRPSYKPKFIPRSYKSLSDTGFDSDDELTAAETDITLDAQDAGAATIPIGTIIRMESEYMYVSGNDAANPSVLTVVRGWASSSAVTHVTNTDIYKIVKGSCVLYLEGQQDAQSGTIHDLSGYGNHGTITGATWVREKKGLLVNSFDGSDDFITITNHASLNMSTGSFTLMTWINVTDVTNYRYLFSKLLNGAPFTGYGFGIEQTTGKLYAMSPNSGTINVGSTGIADGKWHLATFSFLVGSAIGFNIYCDTTNHYQGNSPSDDKDNAASLYLGVVQDGASYPYKGYRGLSRILKGIALSATEIAGIFNQERPLFGV